MIAAGLIGFFIGAIVVTVIAKQRINFLEAWVRKLGGHP